MDTAQFRAKMREIIDSLDAERAVAFEYAFSTGSKPLQEALARTVVLVGDDPIELVDGIVKDDEDEDEVEGWLVVTTADRLIRAVYGQADNGQLDVIVEAVPLSSVQSVRVESVRAGHQEDDAWPGRVKVTLVLGRDVAGVSEIVIPSSAAGEKHLAGAVAALAQRLPMA